MLKMIEDRLTYQEIGDIFNVSKQRVHQLVKNYSLAPYNGKNKNSHKWNFLIGRSCEICSTIEKIEIHHRDGNRNNNNEDNLQSLCREHHLEAEKLLIKNGIKKWNYTNRGSRGKYKECKICNKEIWISPSGEKLGRGKFCSKKCKSIFERKPLIHGIRNDYERGCRCKRCKEAHNLYHRNYWKKKKKMRNRT